MRMIIAAAVAAASVGLVAGQASASIVVLGNTLSGSCSKVAVAGREDRAALDLCSRALAEEAVNGRNLAATLVNRGVIYMRRGDARAALADFEKAVERDPLLGEAYVNRGAVHVSEGRFAQGLADTERGMALGLTAPERAYFNRGMAREWLEDEKGAYLDYRKAAELAPGWELPREQLARFTVISNRR